MGEGSFLSRVKGDRCHVSCPVSGYGVSGRSESPCPWCLPVPWKRTFERSALKTCHEDPLSPMAGRGSYCETGIPCAVFLVGSSDPF